MSKIFHFGNNAKNTISQGVYTVARAVGTTFGANGENVIIETIVEDPITQEKMMIPKLTKDGVTVARHCSLKDGAQNTAAQSLIQVALKMLERVGDGTTTAILLTEALIDLLLRYDLKFAEKEKLKEHVKTLIALYRQNAIKVEDKPEILEGIAHISSNGDKEITDLMKEAIKHVEGDGNILVEVHQALKTTISAEKGIYIPHGFSNHEVVINQSRRPSAEYRDPFVVLYNDRLESLTPLTRLINIIAEKESMTPLVIIAKHISDDAAAMIAINCYSSGIRLAGISLDLPDNECDEMFTDLSVATGIPVYGLIANKVFGDGANGIKYKELHKVSCLRLTKESTIILPYTENKERTEEHLAVLNEMYEKSLNMQDRERIKARKARLSPTFSIIRIGGVTPQSIMEMKDRIEDAICAVMDTKRNGALPGGGAPLIMGLQHMLNTDMGNDQAGEILMRAFLKVLATLLRKSKLSLDPDKFDYLDLENKTEFQSDLAVDNRSNLTRTMEEEFEAMRTLTKEFEGYTWDTPEKWTGLDLSDDTVKVLYDAMIFDPASVIIIALETGVTAALGLMSTGCIITRDRRIDTSSLLSGMMPRNV